MDSGSVLLAGFCLNLKGQTVFSLKLLQDSGSLLCVGRFSPRLVVVLRYIMVWGSQGLSGCPMLSGNHIGLVPTALATLPAGVTSGPVDGVDDCVQRGLRGPGCGPHPWFTAEVLWAGYERPCPLLMPLSSRPSCDF